MADNITPAAGFGGLPVGYRDQSGVLYQRNQMVCGALAADVSPTNPLPVADGAIYEPDFRMLDVDGDGTGNTQANGNYSVTPEIFYIQPAAGEILRISRMIISYTDAGGMTNNEYGNIGAALTNGVIVRKQNNSGTLNLITGTLPVKINSDWGAHCYDFKVLQYGAGNDLALARWTFKESGAPIRLVGDNNERLEVLLNDNFTGLETHCFKVDYVIEQAAS